jgi:hypothetical protein
VSWSKDVNAPYHQQDTDVWCGAAVAQMLLDEIGAGVIDQSPLYATCHSNSPAKWYTHPDGLIIALNSSKPAAFGGTFSIEATASPDDAVSTIVSCLEQVGTPVPSLVQNGAHWVLVCGIQTDSDPATNASYALTGVWINNPWPPTPSFYNARVAPPPPHTDPDICGQGGGGTANEYIANATWLSSAYFDTCDIGAGNQFVCVYDARVRAVPKGIERIVSQPLFMASASPIDATEAIKAAHRGLAEHNLLPEAWVALSQVKAKASPAMVMLVQRLDEPDASYYLVALDNLQHRQGIVAVNAIQGDFQGVHYLQSSTAQKILSRDDVVKMLRALPEIDLGEAARISTRNVHISVEPTLVWQSCQESRSPFYPFYRASAGSHDFYVGIDGRIFPTLHVGGKG